MGQGASNNCKRIQPAVVPRGNITKLVSQSPVIAIWVTLMLVIHKLKSVKQLMIGT